jgi:hypothetical protein
MTNSQKFYLLKKLSDNKKHEYFAKIIPFIHQEVSEATFQSGKSLILRSGLKNEGKKESLLSGKSLSIKEITTFEKYTIALKSINAQPHLDQILLQEEFLFEDHLTIYAENSFYFVEIKNKNALSTVIISSDFVSGSYRYLDCLKNFIHHWSQLKYSGKFIIEAGIKASEIRLFQANEIGESLIKNIFSNDLLIKMIKSDIRRDSKISSLSLLKKEFQAMTFRKNMENKKEFFIEDAFNNWSYLFHYFFIYCHFYKKNGFDQDFIDFLNSCQKKTNWLAKIAAKHIALSYKIRESENSNQDINLESAFRLVSEEAYFLGQGFFKGSVEKIAYLCESLIPEEIYSLDKSKIILTPDFHILSHGFLVALERGIPVVANINRLKFSSIKKEDILTADFINKIFMLE